MKAVLEELISATSSLANKLRWFPQTLQTAPLDKAVLRKLETGSVQSHAVDHFVLTTVVDNCWAVWLVPHNPTQPVHVACLGPASKYFAKIKHPAFYCVCMRKRDKWVYNRTFGVWSVPWSA